MSGVFVESLESRTMLSGPPYVIGSPGSAPSGTGVGSTVKTPPVVQGISSPTRAVLVRDIRPGRGDSITMPRIAALPHSEMVGLGNSVLFTADDGRHGFTLWRSDGTARGTRMVRPRLGSISDLHPMGGNVYFVRWGGNRQWTSPLALWRSDGTAAGTRPVKSFPSGVASMWGFGNQLVLDAISALWISDGTSDGTRMLHDFGQNSAINDMTVADGRFFFTTSIWTASIGVENEQLWVSDGTVGGTRLVTTVAGHITMHDVIGRNVLFTRTDLQSVDTEWISDGTQGGTQRAPWGPNGAVGLNDKIYYIQQDAGAGFYFRHSLWVADEALATRTLIKSFPKGDETNSMGPVYNGQVYFALDDGVHGVELMKTDGTADGTVLVKDIHPGGLGSYPQYLSIVKGKLVFTAYDGVGSGIWSTDGTAQGTKLAKVLTPSAYLDVNNYFNSGTAAYITLHDGSVWRTDGSTGGTKAIGIFAGMRLSAAWFTAAGGHVFFFAVDDAHGAEVWMEK